MEKIHGPKKRKSMAWEYFVPEDFQYPSSSARCTICQTNIKTSGGSTKGMLSHLKGKHNIDTDTGKVPPLRSSVNINKDVRCLFCYEEKALHTSSDAEERDFQIKLENLFKLMAIPVKDVHIMDFKNYSSCFNCLDKVSMVHELMNQLVNIQDQLSIKKNEVEEMLIKSYNLSTQVNGDRYNMLENIDDVFFEERFKIVQKLGPFLSTSLNPSNVVQVKQELDNFNFDQEDISNNLPDLDLNSFEQNFPLSPNLLNDGSFFDQDNSTVVEAAEHKVPQIIPNIKKACINLTPLPGNIYEGQLINLKEEQYQSLLHFKPRQKMKRIKWRKDKRGISELTGQYFEVRKKSKVWYYFLDCYGSQRAKCKICNRVLKTSGSSTRGLMTHLNSLHNIDLMKYTEEELQLPSLSEVQQFELSCSITDDCNFKTYNIHELQSHEKKHEFQFQVAKKNVKGQTDRDSESGIFHEVTKKSKVWLYFLEEENSQRGKCKICGSILKTSGGSTKGLLSHMLSKHQIDLLNCPDDQLPSIESIPPPSPSAELACRYSSACEYKTYSLTRLKSHELKHDSNFIIKGQTRKLECDTCGKHLLSKEKLRIHERLHTKEIPFLCTVCGKGFRAMEYLNCHLATHDRSLYPYKCTLCEKGYFRKRLLEEHEQNHPTPEDENASFPCKLCSKSLKSEKKLNTHMLKHRGNSPTCSQCNIKCKSIRELKLHIHKDHKGGDVLLCHECSREFLRESELKRHIDITHGDRKLEFQCPICKKGYERKCFLSIHIMSHTNCRPYCCKICRKGFYTPYKLKIHENAVHSTLTPFQCQVCFKRFRIQNYLYMHMRIHKKEALKQQELAIQVQDGLPEPELNDTYEYDIVS